MTQANESCHKYKRISRVRQRASVHIFFPHTTNANASTSKTRKQPHTSTPNHIAEGTCAHMHPHKHRPTPTREHCLEGVRIHTQQPISHTRVCKHFLKGIFTRIRMHAHIILTSTHAPASTFLRVFAVTVGVAFSRRRCLAGDIPVRVCVREFVFGVCFPLSLSICEALRAAAPWPVAFLCVCVCVFV